MDEAARRAVFDRLAAVDVEKRALCVEEEELRQLITIPPEDELKDHEDCISFWIALCLIVISFLVILCGWHLIVFHQIYIFSPVAIAFENTIVGIVGILGVFACIVRVYYKRWPFSRR